VEIWSEVLGMEKTQIGINHNFFHLGGHSLKAAILISKIHKELDVTLSMKEIFDHPSIKDIEQVIENKIEKHRYAPIKPTAKRDYYPLTSAQKRLYILNRFDEENESYNMTTVLKLEGAVETDKIDNIFRTLIQRHESLRISFDTLDHGPIQRVNQQVDFHIEYQKIGEQDIDNIVKDSIRPFNLNKAPLLRVYLVNLAENEHLLIVDMHHIISDGISTMILTREFTRLYKGETLLLPNIQYKDYTIWQNKFPEDELQKQEAFWLEKFVGEIQVLNLPTDYPRPTLHSFEGSSIEFPIDNLLTNGLNKIAKKYRCTLFMVLLAAYNVLLHKQSGQEDIIVATSVNGRPHVELHNIVGMFTRTLTMRNYPCGEKQFHDFLREVKVTALDADKNQDYQFEELVEKLNIQRDLSRNPLFDTLFVLQNMDNEPMEIEGLKVTPYSHESKTSKFDICLIAWETREGLVFHLEYCTRLFKKESIKRFISQFKNIFEEINKSPQIKLHQIELLTEAEKFRILYKFNDTKVDYSENKLIHQLFEEQVEKNPDLPAVIIDEQQFTYRKLNERANKLAWELRAKGSKGNSFIAVVIDRSIEMIVGVMAILKAGGAYIPLEPYLPGNRIRKIMDSLNVELLITNKKQLETLAAIFNELVGLKTLFCLDAGEFSHPISKELILAEEIHGNPGKNPGKTANSEDIAYAIFTSGSTGEPKGVVIIHKTVINLIEWVNITFSVNSRDKILFITSLSFDLSVYDIFGILAAGAAVRLVISDDLRKPQRLLDIILDEGITFWDSAPAALQQLVPTFSKAKSYKNRSRLRLVFLSGDWIPVTMPDILRETFAGVKVIALGGATEATIWSNVYPVGDIDQEWKSIPYGKPIWNAKYYILDNYLKPLPIGIQGDLFIGGPCLATGYINDVILTTHKFIDNPFAKGEKIYRTGDTARWFEDGNIEFLGRKDHQVKIRGYRIEMGEIESLLLMHDAIKDAIVIDKTDANGNKYLCAFIVSDEELTVTGLREYLASELPDYMLPSYFSRLDKIPITSNGKVDRKKLATIEGANLRIDTTYVAPKTDMEKKLVDIWQELLNVNQVGTNDNFFDLGGNSLNIITLQKRLKSISPKEIPIVDFFRFTTINALADYLNQEAAGEEVYDRESNKRLLPLINKLSVVDEKTHVDDFKIAVIGMAGRFPGAQNIDEFWENLKQGLESIYSFSDEELLAAGVPAQLLEHPHYVKAKGCLENHEYFDSAFFNYSARDAEMMDPQFRLFHECVWEALEYSGYNPKNYDGLIGLYAGSSSNLFWSVRFLNQECGPAEQYNAFILNDRDFLSTHVSYKLNLKGPSLTIQTACSTSLVAIDTACNALLRGKCDIALAGGVSIIHPMKTGYYYQEGMISSSDGHCRAFDEKADGTISGDGVGIVVLKRLQEAIADGDYIHAVVRSTAINNDGIQKVGYTAPSVEAQAAVIKSAHQAAGVEPETISYVETHGTGTILGDPVELKALTEAFHTDKKGFCRIGSVKTNIGHLDTAAGVAGFIKTVMSLKHRMLPPTIHFNNLNPEIDFANSPFVVNNQLTEWKNGNLPLRAGVSSFGIGGTNAHVVIEEAPQKTPSSTVRDLKLLVLSAKTRSSLERMTQNLVEYLGKNPEVDLADVAFTLQVGKQAFKHREMVVAANTKEAVELLSTSPNTFTAEIDNRPVIFMFSGQGSQYINMGLDLYKKDPEFRDSMDNCFQQLKEITDYDFKTLVYPGENAGETGSEINRTAIAQPLIFALEYSLAKLLMGWGIRPYAMIGHSIGEYVAACLSGVFSLEDALKLVAKRGQLMDTLPGGSMLGVSLGEEDLVPLLPADLSLAAVNASSRCVVSGPNDAIDDFEKKVNQLGYESRRLHTSHAFHSMMMGPILETFKGEVEKIALKKPKLPYISNVSGKWITVEEATSPHYWASHIRETVRFSDGLSELLTKENAVLIEVGAGRALTTFAKQHNDIKPGHLTINLVRHPNEKAKDDFYLTDKMGRLWLYGVKIHWQGLYAGEYRCRVPLPTYPFDRIHYGVDAAVSKSASSISLGPERMENADQPAVTHYHRPEYLPLYVQPRNPVEQTIADIWQNFFRIEKIGIQDGFFDIGGDSLVAITIASEIQSQLNVQVPLTEIFERQTVENIGQYIEKALAKGVEAEGEPTFTYPSKTQDRENLYQPFPLTQIQVAYLMGRDKQFQMGGVSTHAYTEIEGRFDIHRLNKSVNRVIRRQPMLRAIINENGTQHILEEIPVYHIEVEDLRHLTPEEQNQLILKERARMSHYIFPVGQWPMFEIKAFRITDDTHYLFIGIDLIIVDAYSMLLLSGELWRFYENPDLEVPELEFSFRDYQLAFEEIKRTVTYERDKKYWLSKLNDFPSAPQLPLKCKLSDVESPEFNRKQKFFSKSQWTKLKEYVRKNGLTPSAFLSHLYSEVLGYWSNQTRLAINLTIFNRFPFHKDVDEIIGDFTSVLPLDIDLQSADSICERAKKLQKDLMQDLEHRHYEGVDFVRELSKRDNIVGQAVMPIVFTSALFDSSGFADVWENISNVKMGASQTSQVFIDNQVFEENEGLFINWDYAEDLFEEEVIETMFSQYTGLISSIINEEPYALTLPERTLAMIEAYNKTEKVFPPTTLQRLFQQQFRRTPDNIAVELGVEALTYKELDRCSNQLANYLMDNYHLQPGDFIGVITRRDMTTIINILGVVKASLAYVPIDEDYPEERKNYIYRNSECKLRLDSEFYSQQQVPRYRVDKVRNCNLPEDMAYTIYTSGSTGKPKGVMITQRAVGNTLMDINQKLQTTVDDSILGISSLCFDLSVYDMFGTLSSGARLVLIPFIKDIQKVIHTLTTKRITIWNSVPAIMDAVVKNLTEDHRNLHLRKVLLSGDWIPIKLPEKIKTHFPQSETISLGGATEASIWSIYYPITEVSRSWKSIPYGYPLANQSFYVLNCKRELSPLEVPGELYIGGIGVAEGYMNDLEKTHHSFIHHPRLGRIYKTGDCGLFRKEGYIEFLGRKDLQVKIRGFRIELGEVENALINLPEVEEALVCIREDDSGDKNLVAYLIPGKKPPEDDRNISGTDFEKEFTHSVKLHLKKNLPEYMIPTYVILLERFPLTANGKVDRKALPGPRSVVKKETAYHVPQNELETQFIKICQDILGIEKMGIDDNFFELGGHSLKANLLVTRIHQKLDIKIPLQVIFSTPTIRELAQYAQNAETVKSFNIKRVEKREYYVMASAQKSLYFSSQLDEESTRYNNTSAMLIEGNIPTEKIGTIFKHLIMRHEAFRTGFETVDDWPVQKIYDKVHFEVEAFATTRTDINGIILDFIRPFDLAVPPLLRIGYVKLSQNKYLLIIDVHHIISDALSSVVLEKEFIALFAEPALQLPELKIQYKDFAKWQNNLLESDIIKNQENYWLERLSGDLPLLDMPTDFSRPEVKTFAGEYINFVLEKELTQGVKDIANEQAATLYMVLLAVYNILLSKYTMQEEIIVGTPLFGRNHADLEHIVGVFINLIPIRTYLGENLRFTEFLEQVKNNCIKDFENQDYPYETLVNQLDFKRASGRNPLFDTTFYAESFQQDTARENAVFEKIKIEPFHIENTTSKFDFLLEGFEVNGEIDFSLQYSTELFKRSTMEQFKNYFIDIVRIVIKNKETRLIDIELAHDDDKIDTIDLSGEIAFGF